MARICWRSIFLPNKRVVIALQYIHGIGPAKARDIVQKVGIEDARRVNQLTDQEVLQIRETIDRDFTVEGDLRRETAVNIKRLMEVWPLLHRWPAPPQGPAGPRSAYAYQRPDPQGACQADRRQQEK